MRSAGTFIASAPADVAVLIVTFNSADGIDELIRTLRVEATGVRLRVVVVDNSSDDDTVERVRSHRDIVCIESGGNLGYAGGVNVAAQYAGDVRARLILNPDLRVRPGAIRTLLDVLDADPGVGIAAPAIVDAAGRPAMSTFNEPSVFRAGCDALLGPIWRTRPRTFSEWNRRPDDQTRAREVDWATGAALMISRAAAERIGEWDERFFLYSEETDYCRRARDAGYTVRFAPAAVVEHDQGGSGASPALDALLAVSRIRYMRKHSPATAAAYRRVAQLSYRLRAGRSPGHRLAYEMLRDERRWPALPHGSWHGPGSSTGTATRTSTDTDTGTDTGTDTRTTQCSVIIPAHNEEAVIERTLQALHPALTSGAVDAHVVCNGCVDDTALIAAAYGVTVTELSVSSKIAALNAGNEAATAFPRIYLDADIELPSAALPGLLRALARPGILAGRPPFEYDALDSSAAVRAYYRERARIPHLSHALWGAGVYAVGRDGHARIAPFPEVIADDVHADISFAASEKAFPLTPPVRVVVPRRTHDLLAILARARRGATQQGIDDGARTLRALLRTIRGPVSLSDAIVFGVLTARARVRARSSHPAPAWERDSSSRTIS